MKELAAMVAFITWVLSLGYDPRKLTGAERLTFLEAYRLMKENGRK